MTPATTLKIQQKITKNEEASGWIDTISSNVTDSQSFEGRYIVNLKGPGGQSTSLKPAIQHDNPQDLNSQCQRCENLHLEPMCAKD